MALTPQKIKELSVDELQKLAASIRTFLIHSVSKTGGHLSSNLGVVELTLALHYVFDSPADKLIFDIGHQSYIHKIITGRAREFETIRKYQGLSGFQKRKESVHDAWEGGHASTSLSAALGMAAARDLQQESFEIVPIIGDGALTGGMAFEALNDIGAQSRKMIIIFNDNNMSISRNLSGFEKRITDIRTSKLYRDTKHQVNISFSEHYLTKGLLNILHHSREFLKREMIEAPLFTQFNLDYLGPVDGHDIKALIKVLKAAKEHEGPVVIHVLTQKGKGYKPAEEDQVGFWHGVSPFDVETGRKYSLNGENRIEWAQVMADALSELALRDSRICAISPAMITGSRLLNFQKAFPERMFDCGIAEEHALTMAAGMASGGLKPYVSIYSSFLQRAYDQVFNDVARMDLPVVVGIDHAGLVGEDGETHQGIYDIAFLRTIPNVILAQPKDAAEARNLLYSGFRQDHPYFIRYPKATTQKQETSFEWIETGTWSTELKNGEDLFILAYGPDVGRIRERIIDENLPATLINARFFKPVDQKLLMQIADQGKPVFIYEPDIREGGLSTAVLEFYQDQKKSVDLHRTGIAPGYITHGDLRTLKKLHQIDLDTFFKEIHDEIG